MLRDRRWPVPIIDLDLVDEIDTERAADAVQSLTAHTVECDLHGDAGQEPDAGTID